MSLILSPITISVLFMATYYYYYTTGCYCIYYTITGYSISGCYACGSFVSYPYAIFLSRAALFLLPKTQQQIHAMMHMMIRAAGISVAQRIQVWNSWANFS